MTLPRVTVGVPCFQNAKTIARTIASIKSQTFADFRVVVSDDQSDDDTYETGRAEVGTDNRFHVIRQKRNLGFLHFGELLKAIDTPYFVWLAGDDWWEPEFLEQTLHALEENPEAVSALPDCKFLGSRYAKKKPSNHEISGGWRQRVEAFLADTNGTRMYGLCRTSVLQRAFPLRTMNAYDWYLMLGVLKQGPQVSIAKTLMNRERTDWRHYSKLVYEIYLPGLFRQYPLLDMTLSAIKAGLVPPTPRIVRRLYKLNIEKRDECAAVMTPEAFFRNLAGKRRLRISESQSELFAFLAYETLTSKTNTPGGREAGFATLGSLALKGSNFAKERIFEFNKDLKSTPSETEQINTNSNGNSTEKHLNSTSSNIPNQWELLQILEDLALQSEPVARYLESCKSEKFFHVDGRIEDLKGLVFSPLKAALLVHLCKTCNRELTVEIGFGMGSSATVMIGARQSLKKPFQHLIVDPYGLGSGRGDLIQSYLQSEYGSAFQRIWERSEIALGQIIKAHGAGSAGLIFLDGGHRFETVMSDFTLSDILCSDQGYIVFDDACFPAIETVLNYIRSNRADYEFINCPVPNISVLRKVSRDQRQWCSFQPFVVPDRSDWTSFEN